MIFSITTSIPKLFIRPAMQAPDLGKMHITARGYCTSWDMAISFSRTRYKEHYGVVRTKATRTPSLVWSSSHSICTYSHEQVG